MSLVDERAKNILFEVVDAEMRSRKGPSKADVAYAKKHRMLFAPLSATHDQILARTNAALDKLPLAHVADAFLASLTTHRRDLRSGLGSYVVAKTVKKHACEPYSQPLFLDPDHEVCYVCQTPARTRSQSLDFTSFQRHFGPAPYYDPVYRMLDLEELAHADAPALMAGDVVAMTQILRAIEAAETPAKLSTRLQPIVGEDRNARDSLIDTLAVIGVLAPAKSRATDRWNHAAGWVRSDGFDAKRVKQLFGKRGVA